MIRTIQDWTPSLKNQLRGRIWNQSDQIKERWLAEMDNQANVNAHIILNISERTIVLAFERNASGVIFSARKTIQIIEFTDFCNNLQP